ncbi:MAG: hypothetical protein M9933_08970 [Chitinophagaceae bacterium]|nr:hypothetical protein [Chitinophagaceae bacterium]
MGIWRQIAEYLFLKKKTGEPEEDRNSWIKYMHGINRLSILLFLFALLVIMIRSVRSC